jgi:hypothetical protein
MSSNYILKRNSQEFYSSVILAKVPVRILQAHFQLQDIQQTDRFLDLCTALHDDFLCLCNFCPVLEIVDSVFPVDTDNDQVFETDEAFAQFVDMLGDHFVDFRNTFELVTILEQR